MHGPWHDKQFLVAAFKLLESIFAEIPGMCLLAMDKQDCAAYLAGIRQDGHIDERQRGSDIPSQPGVYGTWMIASFGLVIIIREFGIRKLRKVPVV